MAVGALRDLDGLIDAFRSRLLLDSDAVKALVAQQAAFAEAAWFSELEQALLDANAESRERLAHAHHLEVQLTEQAQHLEAQLTIVEADSRTRLARVQNLTHRSGRLAESLANVKALLQERSVQIHSLRQQIAELDRERARLRSGQSASMQAVKRELAQLRARPEVAVGQRLRSAGRRLRRLIKGVS